jgi:hypothetical protein
MGNVGHIRKNQISGIERAATRNLQLSKSLGSSRRVRLFDYSANGRLEWCRLYRAAFPDEAILEGSAERAAFFLQEILREGPLHLLQ